MDHNYYNNYFNELPNTKVLEKFHEVQHEGERCFKMKIIHNGITYEIEFIFIRELYSVIVYITKDKFIEIILNGKVEYILNDFGNANTIKNQMDEILDDFDPDRLMDFNSTSYDCNFRITSETREEFPQQLKNLCKFISNIKNKK